MTLADQYDDDDATPDARTPQLDGESDKAYNWFLRYRAEPRGERSIRGLAKKYGYDVGTLARWSSRWNWRERCQTWDHDLDVIEEAEWADRRRRMGRELAQNADAMQRANTVTIRAALQTIREFADGNRLDSNGDPILLSFDQALTAMRTVAAVSAQTQKVIDSTVGQVDMGRGGMPDVELGVGVSTVDLARMFLQLTGNAPPETITPTILRSDGEMLGLPVAGQLPDVPDVVIDFPGFDDNEQDH